jgi:hypothetical protein
MNRFRTFPWAFLLVVAAGTSAPAGAQTARAGFAFPGIAWGAAEDTLRVQLEAQGFVFRQKSVEGDHHYLRGDSASLQADLRAGRAIGFTLVDPARGEQADTRYRVLADSLRASLGAPDEVVDTLRQRSMLWVGGLASVRLWVEDFSETRKARMAWRGPGWHDEMADRDNWTPPPPGFTTVGRSAFMSIQIDTTRGASGERARFRVLYARPINPTVEGVAQEQMDAVEYEMEIDCAGGRTRLVSRTTYLLGQRVGGARPTGQPWAVPQPGGHYARGRDAICRARRP